MPFVIMNGYHEIVQMINSVRDVLILEKNGTISGKSLTWLGSVAAGEKLSS